MGSLVKVDLFLKRGHDFSKFYCVPVIFRKVLFQEKNEYLVPGIGLW
jgi:hypothetical protein